MLKNLLVAVLLAGAVFVVCRSNSASAAAPVVIDQRLQAPADLTVGDPFRYVIRVEADTGTTVTLAPDGLPFELGLVALPTTRTRNLGNDRIEVTLTLDVAAFAPGELSVPALKLSYREASGASGSIETRPSLLVVNSVLPDSGQVALRDLKPQAEVGSPPASLLVPGLVALILAVVIGFMLWRLRIRMRPIPVAAPVVDPDEVTLEDAARVTLDKAGAAFGTDGDYVPYYLAIAITVRTYLSQRFGFPAFALTTRELQEHMVREGVDRWQARLASGLLSQCDAVVYAQYRPAMERADADLTAAYEIVEMSLPAPQREEVAVSARFADPYFLILLALVPLLALLKARFVSESEGGRFSSLGILTSFRPTWRLRYRWAPTAVRAGALALLVFALARPQTGIAESELPGQGIDIALVLDVSTSMSAAFGGDSRLVVAQRVLDEFVASRENDRIGLVVFRDGSLVLSPLTLDQEALRGIVRNVDQVNLQDGTAIGTGLADGLNLLRESRARSRVAILLTDGQNNAGSIDPLAAARIAEALGIRVYTIGILEESERPGGANNVDERALQEMANVTGGSYFAARDEAALTSIYTSIDALEKSRISRPQFAAYNELAVYFLFASLALLACELGLRSTVWRQAA